MSIDNASLAFSSQVAIDKVVATQTGSFTIPAGSSTSTTVTHNLNRKCFTEMIWSVDGVNFQDGGLFLSSATADTVTIPAADLNTVTIYGGTTEASNQTVTYKLFLLWPS